MKPRISVITVVFNGAETVEQTLLSVASQDYPNVEYIVIDGASTDGTPEIIRRHEDKLAVFRSEPDRGMYDAMNKGLSLSTGDIIGFLNAGDVYNSSRVLSEIVEMMEKHDVDICYGDLVFVDKMGTGKVVRYWKSEPYHDGLFEKGWMPAHPTFYAKQRLYDRYGGYDLKYRRQSDFELTLRFLAVNKAKSFYLPKVLVRMSSGGASSGLWHIIEGNYEAYRACRRHSLDVTPLFIARKILSRVPQFLRRGRFDSLL
jgi:glycosyltransferase involved in cell wall biosynthesis